MLSRLFALEHGALLASYMPRIKSGPNSTREDTRSRDTRLSELQWLPGYCAVTQFSSRMSLCSSDKSGAWHMLPTDDAIEGRRRCAKRCTHCRNCRFVSYSRSQNDCSWYAECNLGALGDSKKFQTDHHSAQVQSDRIGLTRLRRSRPHLQPSHAPPTALLFYHMAKTGGTALRSLLSGFAWRAHKRKLLQQGRKLLLPLVLTDGLQGCFFELFPALFPGHARAPTNCTAVWERAGYAGGGQPAWQRHAIAVEHHGGSSQAGFFNVLEPKLPQLRLLYAAHNGTILTTTVVRSPRAVVRSTYKMWPPRAPAETAQGAAVTAAGGFSMELKRKRLVVLPFGYYLRHRPPLAALANQLLAGSGLEAAECADGNGTSLRSLELARQRLRSFDEVGVTECTRRYWRRLGARLGWSNLVDESIMDAAEAREHNDYYKPMGMEFTQTTTRGLRPWVDAQADSELEPEAAAALERAVSCDATVYADGLWLGGLLVPTVGEHAEAGDERAWLAEAQVREPSCAAV